MDSGVSKYLGAQLYIEVLPQRFAPKSFKKFYKLTISQNPFGFTIDRLLLSLFIDGHRWSLKCSRTL